MRISGSILVVYLLTTKVHDFPVKEKQSIPNIHPTPISTAKTTSTLQQKAPPPGVIQAASAAYNHPIFIKTARSYDSLCLTHLSCQRLYAQASYQRSILRGESHAGT